MTTVMPSSRTTAQRAGPSRRPPRTQPVAVQNGGNTPAGAVAWELVSGPPPAHRQRPPAHTRHSAQSGERSDPHPPRMPPHHVLLPRPRPRRSAATARLSLAADDKCVQCLYAIRIYYRIVHKRQLQTTVCGEAGAGACPAGNGVGTRGEPLVWRSRVAPGGLGAAHLPGDPRVPHRPGGPTVYRVWGEARQPPRRGDHPAPL